MGTGPLYGKRPSRCLVALLVARRLRQLNAKLVEKSDAYDRELDDGAEPRERRDTAAAALTSEVVEIRDALQAALSAPEAEAEGEDPPADAPNGG